MSRYYQGDRVTLHHGNCLDVLSELPDCSVDAVVTDPPYGLANTTPEKITETVIRWANGERDYLPGGKGFMGNPWDSFVPPAAVWDDCLRVLKPGGHVLAFAGSRTVDLMTLGLRMGGFEIRDSIAWLYGSGFPKSLDVSKAIDKQRDDYPAIREVVMFLRAAVARSSMPRARIDQEMGGPAVVAHFLAPSRSNAGCPRWDQWLTLQRLLDFGDEMDAEVWRLNGRKGTPGEAFQSREVIGRSAHKSGIANGTAGHHTVGGTIAQHHDITAPATDAAKEWSGWGTALKPAFEPVVVARKPLAAGTVAGNVLAYGTGALNIDGCRVAGDTSGNARANKGAGLGYMGGDKERGEWTGAKGRWPANVVLDESQAAALDQMSGVSKSGTGGPQSASRGVTQGATHGGQGGGYNYAANGNKTGHGDTGCASRFFYVAKAGKSERPNVDGVAHPTVKPLALMRWLVRLVTPPGGTVLEPFSGSGTTIEAALLEGFNVIGIEREAEYLPLIEARIARALATETDLFGGAA